MLQYVVVGYMYGVSNANENLMSELGSSAYLVFFLASSMGNLDLVKGYWSPIYLPKNFAHLFVQRQAPTQNFIGKKVRLKNFVNNKILKEKSSAAEIIDRKVISNDSYWFVLQLEDTLQYINYEKKFALIKFKKGISTIEQNENYVVYFYLIPDMQLLCFSKIKLSSFKSMGWALISHS